MDILEHSWPPLPGPQVHLGQEGDPYSVDESGGGEQSLFQLAAAT